MSETDDASSVPSYPPCVATTTSKEAARLLRAAADGNLEQVAQLLDSTSADVNTLRARGSTALHEASRAGHLAVVSELVIRAAEVNAVNRSGCTPLHFAALCKDKVQSLKILQFLLQSGSAVTATSDRMDTPLHFACYCQASPGCEDVLQCLLERRATVNARNRKLDSPLINASVNDNVVAVDVLIQHRADIGQRNAVDKSAHDIAMERGCAEVLQVLEKSRDPMSQLTDITQQMRTALNQMQTVDMLSSELRRQTALCEALESVVVAAMAELDAAARVRLAEQTINTLREHSDDGDGMLAPASMPMSQHRVLQALACLLFISRSPGGDVLLHELNVAEVLPHIEQQTIKFQVGHKELRELKMALCKVEVSTDHSRSSSPSSWRQVEPSTASPFGHRTVRTASLGTSRKLLVSSGRCSSEGTEVESGRETPTSMAESEAALSALGHQQRRQSNRSVRSCGWEKTAVSAPSILPLLADDRRIEERPDVHSSLNSSQHHSGNSQEAVGTDENTSQPNIPQKKLEVEAGRPERGAPAAAGAAEPKRRPAASASYSCVAS